LQTLPSLFVSVPTFWLGIVLIQVISFRLKLVSVIAPGEWEVFILPTAALAIPISAPLAQILIRSIDEVQTLNFIAVARAKGASRQRVLWRHVAKNAILPTLGLNGLGALTRDAVSSQDTSVLQAIVVLSAAVFVVINLFVDLLYPVLDPRLRRKIGSAA
jgi:peptide/nickel transport system permease protein